MGILNFFRRKKEIEVNSIGTLKYLKAREGNIFYAYVQNGRINQNYELFIYSEVFTMPKEQIEYYNKLIDSWDAIIAKIKTKLQEEKKVNAENLLLIILGINEKGNDKYDAALAFTLDDLNFTVILRKFEIKEIQY